MKSQHCLTALFIFAASSIFAAKPVPPACTLIKPEKLTFYEDVNGELAATSLKRGQWKCHSGQWTYSDGVIKGTQDVQHLFSLKFEQLFENCVLTFRLRFVDPGVFIFVGGNHTMDVAFASEHSDPESRKNAAFAPSKINILGRDRYGKGPRQIVGSEEKTFPEAVWITVVIEHAGDQIRAKIGDTEIIAKSNFDEGTEGKQFFFLNAGQNLGSRVEFDDIALWTGTRLTK